MCFVSATAPLMTAEQMKEERDMLSLCEQMELAHDVLGSCGSRFQNHQRCCGTSTERYGEEPSEALRRHCLQELEETIEMATPKDQQAYRMALQQCPDVVIAESNPMRFLISENYDIMAAATKLLRYWTLRRGAFGDDRAFRPMTIDGSGAMSVADINVYRRLGCLFVGCDEANRPVIYFDRSKFYSLPDRHGFTHRCLFYALTFAMRNATDENYDKGWVLLVNSTKSRVELYDRRSCRIFLSILQSIPSPLKVMHDIDRQTSTFQSVTMPQVFHMMGHMFRKRYLLHILVDTESLLLSLRRFGLLPSIIPTSLGGQLRVQC